MRNDGSFWVVLSVGVVLVALPQAAFAYVGPGVGLTAIGTFLAFVAVIFLGIVGFLWYPIRRLLRGRSAKAPARASAEETAEGRHGEHAPRQ